ncbi:Hypothetical predicted protein [Mytilus galloprovincialis]|uniref:Uncharacterized protein n=2 Tax=Mytilus TaxID=6548 RepID=A0A8B6DPK0_MYTGA|nr:Hypothetical predicted protein [Mytilus galloprovincialis]
MEDEREDGPATVHRDAPSHPPRNPVDLVGGVMVYCDPGTWPSALALQEPPGGSPWVTAIGVHPKKAQQLDDSSFDKMERLLGLPGVRAIG